MPLEELFDQNELREAILIHLLIQLPILRLLALVCGSLRNTTQSWSILWQDDGARKLFNDYAIAMYTEFIWNKCEILEKCGNPQGCCHEHFKRLVIRSTVFRRINHPSLIHHILDNHVSEDEIKVFDQKMRDKLRAIFKPCGFLSGTTKHICEELGLVKLYVNPSSDYKYPKWLKWSSWLGAIYMLRGIRYQEIVREEYTNRVITVEPVMYICQFEDLPSHMKVTIMYDDGSFPFEVVTSLLASRNQRWP